MFKIYILVCVHKCLDSKEALPPPVVFISRCTEGCWPIESAKERIVYKLQERKTTQPVYPSSRTCTRSFPGRHPRVKAPHPNHRWKRSKRNAGPPRLRRSRGSRPWVRCRKQSRTFRTVHATFQTTSPHSLKG